MSAAVWPLRLEEVEKEVTRAAGVTRRYRRSTNLVSYWQDGRAWVTNFATGVRTESTPALWSLLDACHDWQTPTVLRRTVARSWPDALFKRIVDAMVKATLLEASDAARDPRESRMAAWQGWNPAAGLFHAASRAGDHGDPQEHDAHLHRKARTSRMPAPIKTASGRRVSLPAPARTAISGVLHDRRTWRQFADTPVTRDQIATMLALTAGITHWLTVPGLGQVPLTTSPSGGSRHPIETYIVIRNIRGVAPGVYRYLGDRHELEVIRRGLKMAELRRWLPQQTWWHTSPFIVFFTGVFERTQWRYEFPRAYRAVLLETGHICQTFLLAATSLGLAPFCTMAINDEHVERALGIDGISEAVLYAAGAGARPSDVNTRVVMPSRSRPARVRVNASTRGRRSS